MLALSSTSALALLAFASSTAAHFTMTYPPSRGFDEDIEANFCGGFNNPAAVRTPYSLSNTSMSIFAGHPTATISVLISLDANPTSFAQFSNGTTLPFVRDFFQVTQGDQCFPVDISSALSSQQIKNGTDATLMVRFDGGDGDLFQCCDVTLLTDYTAPSNATCSSSDAVAPSGASSAASKPSASSAASPSSSTLASSAQGRVSLKLSSAGLVALAAVGGATLIL